VPLLPAGRITVVANRSRELLGRLHGSMAPPPVRILEGLFGVLEHQVLVSFCDAGVPDALHGPRRIADLATVGRLSPRAGDGHSFLAANGVSFFEWMADHPDRWATFDRAMAAGGRMHALGLAAVLEWFDGERVCDVGGGTGDLLAALLDLVAGIEGAPDVVTRAVAHPRLTAVGGDAFAHVAAGFDTYLLVNVLHDWDDDGALRILRRVAEAAAPTARVVVLDSDRTTVPRADIAISADVLMAALTDGGKERDTGELTELARRAGLVAVASHRLPSADLAHVFRPAPA